MASKTVSSSKTTNDFNGISEGGGSITGNVLDNDTVSGAKAVTSVKIGDVTKAVSSTGTTTITGKYGTFVFKADGSYTYTLDESKAALQALAEGQTDNEHPVYYTVNNITTLNSNLIVRVTGINDAAIISGTSTGSVDEDNVINTASGALLSDDVDNPDNVFQADSGSATYGSFAIDADGNWTYTLDNDNADVDALNDSGTLSDSFTVKSADGTEQTVSVTITGTNDAAVISGDTSGSVDEDNVTNTAVGTLLADDVDNPDNVFQAASGDAQYGSFSIDENGNWTYTLDNGNADVNALNDSDSLSDSFTVKSADGTEQTVSVTINGATDVILPPSDGGGGGGGSNGSAVNHMVNFGNKQSAHQTLSGFDANDTLKYSANVSFDAGLSDINYDGDYEVIDYGNDGISDTIVYFTWTHTVQGNTVDDIVDVTLIGFTGLTDSQVVAVNG